MDNSFISYIKSSQNKVKFNSSSKSSLNWNYFLELGWFGIRNTLASIWICLLGIFITKERFIETVIYYFKFSWTNKRQLQPLWRWWKLWIWTNKYSSIVIEEGFLNDNYCGTWDSFIVYLLSDTHSLSLSILSMCGCR